MEPTKVTPKQLKKITEDFKQGLESAIGIYLFKDLRIQISKYKASGAERFARLYRNRRAKGLCVICAQKADAEGNVQHARERLGQQSLAAARRADQQNVALFEFDIIHLAPGSDTFVMVVDGHA